MPVRKLWMCHSFGPINSELAAEAIRSELIGNLQEHHPGKAASMGVGGIVILRRIDR